MNQDDARVRREKQEVFQLRPTLRNHLVSDYSNKPVPNMKRETVTLYSDELDQLRARAQFAEEFFEAYREATKHGGIQIGSVYVIPQISVNVGKVARRYQDFKENL